MLYDTGNATRMGPDPWRGPSIFSRFFWGGWNPRRFGGIGPRRYGARSYFRQSYRLAGYAATGRMPRPEASRRARFSRIRPTSRVSYGAPKVAGASYTVSKTLKLSRDARIRLGAQAVDEGIRGLRHLPVRTKAIAGVAALGAFWWMHRNKKEKFYTRYYNY